MAIAITLMKWWYKYMHICIHLYTRICHAHIWQSKNTYLKNTMLSTICASMAHFKTHCILMCSHDIYKFIDYKLICSINFKIISMYACVCVCAVLYLHTYNLNVLQSSSLWRTHARIWIHFIRSSKCNSSILLSPTQNRFSEGIFLY